MQAEPSLTVLSLGGGVQSSVMALMASQGAFDRVPDCAVFADTRWEPPGVYEHIEWLSKQLSFPLHVVDNGRSLRGDVKALTNHSGSRSYVDIPVYLKGRNGEGDGIGRRQCTDNYKIRPIRKKIRELARTQTEAAGPRWNHRRALAGNLHRRGHPHEGLPRQVDGEPLSPHRGGHVPKGLPGLVAEARYDRPLERSACVACPFQSRQRWVETKRRWPELFAEAVEIDARLRGGLAFAKEPYLHTLRMPLVEAVALDEAKLGADGQRDGFGNECEGHCGV